nr:sigma factor-like helix-turn-helix DNA-binding protein [Streptomyces sp. 3211]
MHGLSMRQEDRTLEFRMFISGAARRLLHTATLLTAEPHDENPRARRLLTLTFAYTYACWDRLRGEDPYDRARQHLATRFAYSAWRQYGGLPLFGRARPSPGTALARLSPMERLVLVLRFFEGIEEEQIAAALGLSVDRVRALYHRAATKLLRPTQGLAQTPDNDSLTARRT